MKRRDKSGMEKRHREARIWLLLRWRNLNNCVLGLIIVMLKQPPRLTVFASTSLTMFADDLEAKRGGIRRLQRLRSCRLLSLQKSWTKAEVQISNWHGVCSCKHLQPCRELPHADRLKAKQKSRPGECRHPELHGSRRPVGF